MIVTAGIVAVVAAVLAFIWAMQRRFMYFPTSDVPAPGAIGLNDVEAVTFETMRRAQPERVVLRGVWTITAGHSSGLQRKRRQSSASRSTGGSAPAARIPGSARRLSGLWRKSWSSIEGWARRRRQGRASVSGRSARRRTVAAGVLRRVTWNGSGCRPRRRTPAGGACPAIAVHIDGRPGSVSLSVFAGASSSPGPVRSDRSDSADPGATARHRWRARSHRADRQYPPTIRRRDVSEDAPCSPRRRSQRLRAARGRRDDPGDCPISSAAQLTFPLVAMLLMKTLLKVTIARGGLLVPAALSPVVIAAELDGSGGGWLPLRADPEVDCFAPVVVE